MGYVIPPRVPTNRQSQYGGRQHVVIVLALHRGRQVVKTEFKIKYTMFYVFYRAANNYMHT